MLFLLRNIVTGSKRRKISTKECEQKKANKKTNINKVTKQTAIRMKGRAAFARHRCGRRDMNEAKCVLHPEKGCTSVAQQTAQNPTYNGQQRTKTNVKSRRVSYICLTWRTRKHTHTNTYVDSVQTNKQTVAHKTQKGHFHLFMFCSLVHLVVCVCVWRASEWLKQTKKCHLVLS